MSSMIVSLSKRESSVCVLRGHPSRKYPISLGEAKKGGFECLSSEICTNQESNWCLRIITLCQSTQKGAKEFTLLEPRPSIFLCEQINDLLSKIIECSQNDLAWKNFKVVSVTTTIKKYQQHSLMGLTVHPWESTRAYQFCTRCTPSYSNLICYKVQSSVK